MQLIIQSPDLFICLVGLFGLCLGSFLNVVIRRYPAILERQWQAECQAYLELKGADAAQPSAADSKIFNLATPRSHCPHCKKTIPWHCNIPLFSFLFLKGRSRCCQQHISSQYFWVELFSLIGSVAAAWLFGPSLMCLATLVFFYMTLCLYFIDLNTKLLPDNIVLSLLWLGLLFNSHYLLTSPKQAILGAVFGYSSLWLLAKLFYLLRKKEGLGYGDFKMLAMLGAWFGVSYLPLMLLFAAVVALLINGLMLCRQKIERDSLIAFGPYLALSGWLFLFFGQWLNPLLTRWLF